MFDEKFIAELPENGYKAAQTICKMFFRCNGEWDRSNQKVEHFNDYLRALVFAQLFLEIHGIDPPVKPSIVESEGASTRNISLVYGFFTALKPKVDAHVLEMDTRDAYQEAKEHYGRLLGMVHFYEFSDEDFRRVQELINTLRDILQNSEDFEEDHKRRLLKRLEKLQAELNKKMSNLDLFWGLFPEAGVALGKFWTEAEPFVEGVKEILQIVYRAQARAANVPKLLPTRLLLDEKSSTKAEDPDP